MRLTNKWIVSAMIVLAVSVVSVNLSAQDAEQAAMNPLASLERFVGGKWFSGENYQTFEWGIGQKSVVGTSYFLVDGKHKLVGDGFYFWHPGDSAIRGYFTGTEMGIDLFEYRIHEDGNKLIADLTTYGAMSGDFEEIYEFTSDTTFEWTLNQIADDGAKSKMMGATYFRR